MKTGLGGYVVVRNGVRLDYCFDLAIKSLLPVCSEVIACDSDSDDGTREKLDEMAALDPRIKVVNWPWTNPKGVSHHAFIEWLNFARSHLKSDCQITLDADEVLDDNPLCHKVILDAIQTDNPCRYFDRLNFWRDRHSIIPEGHTCGKFVARLGPTAYPMVSDQPLHPGESKLIDEAVRHPDLKIFHLGFLREKDAMYRKCKAVLDIWFNRYDTRLEKAEAEGKPIWESECEFTDLLVPYNSYYPASVDAWLKERGR